MVELESITLQTFEPRVGETFALDAGDAGRLELRLESARGTGEAPEGLRDPFSLVFRGPRDPILPQRIYRLENPALGTLEIFIVPVGRDDAGTRYEAVFA
jgi:hypothetical protein